jgi:hypothetical protein
LQRPIVIIAIWSIYAFTRAYKCENKFDMTFEGSTTEGMCS